LVAEMTVKFTLGHRKGTYNFLLVFHWNYVSTAYRFQDITTCLYVTSNNIE